MNEDKSETTGQRTDDPMLDHACTMRIALAIARRQNELDLRLHRIEQALKLGGHANFPSTDRNQPTTQKNKERTDMTIDYSIKVTQCEHRRAVAAIMERHRGDERAVLSFSRVSNLPEGLPDWVRAEESVKRRAAAVREAAVLLEAEGVAVDYTYMPEETE
ncbi:hypothetical protein [Bifidobacterium longum]